MILGILVLAFIMYLALGYGGEVKVNQADCKPHIWTLNEEDRLVCSTCKKIPGQDD